MKAVCDIVIRRPISPQIAHFQGKDLLVVYTTQLWFLVQYSRVGRRKPHFTVVASMTRQTIRVKTLLVKIYKTIISNGCHKILRAVWHKNTGESRLNHNGQDHPAEILRARITFFIRFSQSNFSLLFMFN